MIAEETEGVADRMILFSRGKVFSDHLEAAFRTGEWTMSCGGVLFGLKGFALLQTDGSLLRWPIRCAYCGNAYAVQMVTCEGCGAGFGAVK